MKYRNRLFSVLMAVLFLLSVFFPATIAASSGECQVFEIHPINSGKSDYSMTFPDGSTLYITIDKADKRLQADWEFDTLNYGLTELIARQGQSGVQDKVVPITSNSGSFVFDDDNVQSANNINRILFKICPAMTLTKTAVPTTVNAGETVNYTITVQNTGNTTLLGVTVEDEMLDLFETIGDLEVGGSRTFNASYPTTNDDVGSLKNTAEANANGLLPVEADATVTVNAAPIFRLSVSKTANPTSVFVGDDVDYTIRVTNTGNQPLTNVVISDPDLELNKTVDLVAGAYVEYNKDNEPLMTYTTTSDDLGTLSNTVTAVVYDVAGPETATANVTVSIRPTFALEVTKEANVDEAYVGDEIDYVITVKNAGNQDLTGVRITDPMLGIDETVDLISLETVTYGDEERLTYVATVGDIGTLRNTVTAEVYEVVGPVTADADVEILPNYSLGITKISNVSTIVAGGTITYTVTVTNNSDIPVEGVEITDTMFTVEGGPFTLPVGESEVFVFTRPTSIADIGTLTNTATAGIPELIEPVSATRTVSVTAPAVTGGGTGGRSPAPAEEEVVIPPTDPPLVVPDPPVIVPPVVEPPVVPDEEVIIEVDEVPLELPRTGDAAAGLIGLPFLGMLAAYGFAKKW